MIAEIEAEEDEVIDTSTIAIGNLSWSRTFALAMSEAVIEDGNTK